LVFERAGTLTFEEVVVVSDVVIEDPPFGEGALFSANFSSVFSVVCLLSLLGVVANVFVYLLTKQKKEMFRFSFLSLSLSQNSIER
jgi:hypothetical protein